MSGEAGVTLREAVRRTGYSDSQLRRFVKGGRVRAKRRGGRWLLHPADVERMEQSEWQGQAWQAKEG